MMITLRLRGLSAAPVVKCDETLVFGVNPFVSDSDFKPNQTETEDRKQKQEAYCKPKRERRSSSVSSGVPGDELGACKATFDSGVGVGVVSALASARFVRARFVAYRRDQAQKNGGDISLPGGDRIYTKKDVVSSSVVHEND